MAGPLPQSYRYLPVPAQVEHVEEGSISIPATGKSPVGYTIYQVVFKTKTPTPQGYLAIVECNVWKRYSDFQHLEKELEEIHAASGVPVKFPSLVKASYFGRFKDTVIEDRRASAEALLHFAVHSQHLRHSPPLLDFLKSAAVPLQPLQMAGNPEEAEVPPPPPPDYSESEGHIHQQLADWRDQADGSISQEELNLLIGDSTGDSSSMDPSWHTSERDQNGCSHLTEAQAVVASGRGPTNSVLVDVGGEGGTQGAGKGSGGPTDGGGPELDELGLTEWTMEQRPDLWSVATIGTPSDVGASAVVGSECINLLEDPAVPLVSSQLAPMVSSQLAPVVSSQLAPVVSSQLAPVVSSQLAPVVSSQLAPVVSSQLAPGVSSQLAPVVSDQSESTDWWSQALAATQEISDDFDSLVEENENKNTAPSDDKVANKGTIEVTLDTAATHQPPVDAVAKDNISPEGPHSECQQPTNPTGGMDLLAADIQMSRTSSSDSIGSQGGKAQGSNSNSRSPSPPQREANPRLKDKNAYVIQASKLISRALQYEQQEEYQEAFDLLKAGVDLLLNGVQTDNNRKRRDIVRTRTAQYLQHAEELHLKYLGPKTPTLAKVPSVPNIQSVVTPHHLKDFKVINTIGKVMVVESRHTHLTYVIKVIHRTSSPAVRGLSMKSRMTVPCPHMVNLLHQYDSANRSFLLLEHIKGGKLVDFVAAKRKQWTALKQGPMEKHDTPTKVERHATPINTEGHATPINTEEHATPINTEEQLLDELSTLSPPSGAPGVTTPHLSPSQEEVGLVTKSLDDHPAENGLPKGEEEGEEKALDSSPGAETCEPTESLDRLSELRRQLESLSEGGVAAGTSICVEPPTPSEEDKPYLGSEENGTVGLGIQAKTTSSSSLAFTPVSSLINSPDQGAVDNWVQRMENNVREWSAKVVLALEHLHAYGIVCRDLNPSNLLLDNNGNVKLTYFGSWEGVDFQENYVLRESLYMAPELSGCQEATPAADWWSLGAILFELLSGQTLVSCHPDGVHSHLPLHLPVSLSSEATALLHQLLQIAPSERIGAGSSGVEELKAHPFFSSINWTNI